MEVPLTKRLFRDTCLTHHKDLLILGKVGDHELPSVVTIPSKVVLDAMTITLLKFGTVRLEKAQQSRGNGIPPMVLSRIPFNPRFDTPLPTFFAKVMQKYGKFTHRLSHRLSPQTSGQVEVSNRGLKRILERTNVKNRLPDCEDSQFLSFIKSFTSSASIGNPIS
ncbi:reverse transcriptase domain-containing protein [Tanacetum coccineum]